MPPRILDYVQMEGAVRLPAEAEPVASQPQKSLELADERTELEQALQEKEAASEVLRVADSAKDRFLALLSHELRNPLASVRAAALVLASAPVASDDSVRASKIIERQTTTMKMLLDDLLDIAKMRLGRLTLRQSSIEFGCVVERAIEMTKASIDAAHLDLEVEMPREPIVLSGDELRLSQVLANLLANAAKYTEAGGRIRLVVTSAAPIVLCRISDNGRGLDCAHLEAVFELFWQGDTKATNAATEGFGLGLPLVRTIVELHGGSLTAESEGIGRGSTFTVTLPLSPERDRTIARRTRDSKAASARPGGGRVLLVDDDADAAWTLAKALELSGYEVAIAHDGASALETIERLAPDTILLDISMPGMQGDEVARRVRALPQATHARIVAVTGWSAKASVSADRDAFDAYLMKPVGLDELIAAIGAETSDG